VTLIKPIPVNLRVGTRGSALAMAQAAIVAEALVRVGVEQRIVVVETEGDRRAPDTAWGEGAFVAAIERALLEGRVDVAVHSAKDIPTDEDPRLTIAAFLPREDPRDALVLRDDATGTLRELPPGSVLGTDSPRRTGFLRAARPDLVVQPLHGNVDTRLRRLDGGDVDGLVLAAAGLIRLGRANRIHEYFDAATLPSAAGQGAIAVQVRRGDARTSRIVSTIDDSRTRAEVETERAFLAAAGGGCRAPVGIRATVDGEQISLTGGFATLDGSDAGVDVVAGSLGDGLSLAQGLAAQLAKRRAARPGAPRVLVTRPATESHQLSGRLAEHGIAAVCVPAIEVEILQRDPALEAAIDGLSAFRWAVATSANGARAAQATAERLGVGLGGVRWAAVGNATARRLIQAGAADVWLPATANASALGQELPVESGDPIVWIHGNLADQSLAETLRTRGAVVTAICGYRTTVAPQRSRELLRRAMAEGPFAALTLASPSAVEGLLALAPPEAHAALTAVPVATVGPRTTSAARSAGFKEVAEASAQDAGVLAEIAAELALRAAKEVVGAK
jgi:hydroxymethylbilane synthase